MLLNEIGSGQPQMNQTENELCSMATGFLHRLWEINLPAPSISWSGKGKQFHIKWMVDAETKRLLKTIPYRQREIATRLCSNYFGGNVVGFYNYKANRHTISCDVWICHPLATANGFQGGY